MYEMATRSSRRIAAAKASAQIQQWINESDDQEEEMSSDDEFGVESETEDVVEYQRSEPDTASCSSSEEESESIVPSSDSLLSRTRQLLGVKLQQFRVRKACSQDTCLFLLILPTFPLCRCRMTVQ